jgi:hypothetical protein
MEMGRYRIDDLERVSEHVRFIEPSFIEPGASETRRLSVAGGCTPRFGYFSRSQPYARAVVKRSYEFDTRGFESILEFDQG